MFAINIFQLLLNLFHLMDNEKLVSSGHPGYDPCAKFDTTVSHVNSVF